MMVAVPPVIPVRIPVVAPIVPTAVLLLLQVPPVLASLRVVVLPAHIGVVPIMAPGVGFTVIVVVVLQPPGKV